jgi:ParB-like nuclease domain
MARAKKAAPPAKPIAGAELDETPTELVEISTLRPHPRNYKKHPDDQLAHVVETIRLAGVYKNIVIARDGTILMGHGVVQAAEKAGRSRISARRLDVDPDDPRALKLVAADNEITNLAEVDDRALTDMLRGIMESDVGLLGSGFDEQQLAALAFVTRPASELRTFDEAAAWTGMPEFEAADEGYRVVVNLVTPGDRKRFLDKLGVKVIGHKNGRAWSIWWPERPRQDLASVKFEAGAKKKAARSR